MKTFNDYQDWTDTLAQYNTDVVVFTNDGASENPIPYIYPVLALAEEAGEVAGKVGKAIRKSINGDPIPADSLRDMVRDELGDLQYQIAQTARQFGWTLQDIIDRNHEKLTDRQTRGVLEGSGDNR